MTSRRAALAAALLLLPACAAVAPVFSSGAVFGWLAPFDPVSHTGRIATLPSGMRVVVYRFAGERDVTLRVTYAGGEETEPAGKAGVALLAASLSDRASPGVGGISLLERRYAAGALTTHRVTADELTFVAQLKPAYLRQVVATEADRLTAPVAGLTEEMVAGQREVVAAALERQEGTREDQADAAARRALTGTPYGRAGATPASVRALTLADVKAYLAGTLVPERCVLVVSSGQDPLDVMNTVIDSLRGRAAVPSGRAPFGAGRPFATASPPRDLATLALRTEERRLWLGWPVPGAAGGQEPAILAAAVLLEDALSTRAARPDLASQVRGVAVRPQQGDLAAALLAEVRLTREADAAAVRGALEAEAAALHERRQATAGRSLLRAMRNARYLVHQGRAPIDDVARGVRVQDEPDPVRRFEDAAEAQLGPKLAEQLEAWLAPRSSAALLVEPRADDPVPAGAEAAAWSPDTWLAGIDLVAMAAPGAADVRRLVEPPGLDAALRERLPNGLEVVVLPRGVESFVHAGLFLPGGTAQVDELLRAQHALALHRHRLPSSWCRLVTGTVYPDGTLLTLSGPASGLRFALEALACWTRDTSAGIDDPESSDEDRRVRRARAEAFLSAPPPGEDLRPDFYRRWLRRALAPDGATLVVTGALDAGATLEVARQVLGAWTPIPGEQLPLRPTAPPAQRRAVVVGTAKARRAWAVVALRRAEPITTNQAVEDALAALFQRDLGLKLFGGDVVVEVVQGGGPGWRHWNLKLSGLAERIAPAVAVVLGELERLSKGGVGLAAADAARWDAARSAAYAWDTAREARFSLVWAASRRLPADAWERYPAELAAVDAAALEAALAGTAVGREGIVAHGDAAVLAPALRALGLDVQVVGEAAPAAASR